MFFRHIALVALLLSSGCVGQTIREDTDCRVVPRGAADVLKRSFAPRLTDFIDSLSFSTFDDTDCGYSGYYFPGVGVRIAAQQVGHVEFETSLVHEVLHAVHFHGLVDKDRFQEVLDRLRTECPDFVDEATSSGWRGFVYALFTQSEYFARVGDEIVRRRGIDVPPYLWDIYRGILHPSIEEHGRIYARAPFPERVQTQFRDGTTAETPFLQHLGFSSVHDTVLPRRDVTGFTLHLDVDVPAGSPAHVMVMFQRRSSPLAFTSCAGTPVLDGGRLKLRCHLEPLQARDIVAAWHDYDLAITVIDPVVAMQPPR